MILSHYLKPAQRMSNIGDRELNIMFIKITKHGVSGMRDGIS